MNPFNTGSKVKDPALFTGRVREIQEILSKIRNGLCVSVVGERRIGKSSLLYYLYQTAPTELGIAPQRIVYLDLLDVRYGQLLRFVENLLESLGMIADIDDMVRSPHLALSRCLRKYAQGGSPAPIVFMDELDKVRELPELRQNDFFENLRSLCDEGYLCLVTASKANLQVLCESEGITSPFWNIFSYCPLGEWVVDEYLDERALFLERHWAPLQPTETEMRWLLSYTSTHPLVMQIVSFNVYQNRLTPRSEASLRAKIASDVTAHFPRKTARVAEWLAVSADPAVPQRWQGQDLRQALQYLRPLTDIDL